MRVIVIEQTLPFPREMVWEALTDSGQLEVWLMPNDFRLEVGLSDDDTPLEVRHIETGDGDAISCVDAVQEGNGQAFALSVCVTAVDGRIRDVQSLKPLSGDEALDEIYLQTEDFTRAVVENVARLSRRD